MQHSSQNTKFYSLRTFITQSKKIQGKTVTVQICPKFICRVKSWPQRTGKLNWTRPELNYEKPHIPSLFCLYRLQSNSAGWLNCCVYRDFARFVLPAFAVDSSIFSTHFPFRPKSGIRKAGDYRWCRSRSNRCWSWTGSPTLLSPCCCGFVNDRHSPVNSFENQVSVADFIYETI